MNASKNSSFWRVLGVAAALTALALLISEHFIVHGRDLNPVDHWLSEYVLSGSVMARWIMRVAFVSLAASSLSVAILSRDRASRILFSIAAIGLVAMPFFDTDPNDGRSFGMHWPLTTGNAHQLLLYFAIGATLLGMGWQCYCGGRLDPAFGFLAIVASATVIQFVLVITSQRAHTMTHFGGLTERVIVSGALGWVVGYCRQPAKEMPTLKPILE